MTWRTFVAMVLLWTPTASTAVQGKNPFLGKLKGRDDLEVTGAELLKQVIDQECARAAQHLVFCGMWVPNDYREKRFLERVDEYIYLLATFEAFGVSNLFVRTPSFTAAHNLNRHGILHGKWTNFGRPENFHRLWSILDMIAFALTMGTSGVSAFAPATSPKAFRLALKLGALGHLADAVLAAGDAGPSVGGSTAEPNSQDPDDPDA